MRNNTSLPKSWVNSTLTRALAEKGLDSTHKAAKATGMSWNMIESIASGKTRMPRDKTIQKLMTITGLSRAQFGAHTRVVNALHAEVDKSVTTKAVRLKATKPSAKSDAPVSSNETTEAIRELTSVIRTIFRV